MQHLEVRTQTGLLGIRIFINVTEWSDVSSRRLLFSLLDTNDFISERGGGFVFFNVSRESIFFFTHQVEQKYFLSIHDDEVHFVEDTCISL